MSDLLTKDAEIGDAEILKAAQVIRRKREQLMEQTVRSFPLFKTPKNLTDVMVNKLRQRLDLPGGTTGKECAAAVLHLMQSWDQPTRRVSRTDLEWLAAIHKRKQAIGKISADEAAQEMVEMLKTSRVDEPLSEAEVQQLHAKQEAERPARWKWAQEKVVKFLESECGTLLKDQNGQLLHELANGKEPGSFEFIRGHYKRV